MSWRIFAKFAMYSMAEFCLWVSKNQTHGIKGYNMGKSSIFQVSSSETLYNPEETRRKCHLFLMPHEIALQIYYLKLTSIFILSHHETFTTLIGNLLVSFLVTPLVSFCWFSFFTEQVFVWGLLVSFFLVSFYFYFCYL